MNKGLIVLDVQRGLTMQRDVSATVSKIESVMATFEKMNWPMVFTKHIDEQR